MGFFKKNKQESQNMVSKKKAPTPNALNEDDLLNIAGGQEFHGVQEKLDNINKVSDVVNKK